MTAAAWIAAAYLLGCVNGAYYAARLWRGLDIRDCGSGTAGATNAGRFFGKRGFLLVMAFDAGKMLLALKLASLLFPGSDAVLGFTMAAVLLGHVFPCQLGFRGGKGVSSFIGAGLFLFSPLYSLLCAALFGLLFAATGKYTFSGLAALCAAVAAYPLGARLGWLDFSPPLWGAAAVSLGIVLAASLGKGRLVFKRADAHDEFDQIFRLNHRTFAEEIPQHEKNASGRIVDRFFDKTAYFVCKKGGRVIGMVAYCDQRPFSLDEKVKDLDSFLPPGCGKLCEIRLLSVEKEYRKTAVFIKLIRLLLEYGKGRGARTAVISATTRQLKLYRHMGFVPFNGLVGTKDAPYQPMYGLVGVLEKNLCAKR